MSDDAKTTIGAAVLVVGFLAALIGVYYLSVLATQERCTEQFGAGWTAKFDSHGPNFCINEQGEAKYTR